MASRESQGLQIALILFVMVTVVLAVTTFVFYRSAEHAKKEAASARSNENTQKQRADDADFKVQYLMHILGAATLPEASLSVVEASIAADEQMQTIQQSYQRDMQTFQDILPEGKANYLELPGYLMMSLRDKNVANTSLSEQVANLEQEKRKITDAETKRTADAQQSMQSARDELADERTKFNNNLGSLQTEQETQLATYSTSLNKLKGDVKDHQQRESEAQADVAKLQNVVADQKETIVEMRDEPFEVADGRVTLVNQGTDTVWINLGLADGLRRQTLFSVYDIADNGVTRAERKASIEVTKVLDQHLAEARIVSDYPADPILPGDQVFSPAWRPGRKVRFALAGFLDVDGDRRSDRDLIRNLITASGAMIDAEVHDDGTMEGELTASTRYLVQGDAPTERSDSKTLIAFSNIRQTADELGVEIIPVDKLLSWMGYKPEVRSVGLGKSADPNQFKIAPAEGKARTSTGNVSGKFRERRPPPRRDDSAY